MKKAQKIFKVIFISAAIFFIGLFTLGTGYYISSTHGESLNVEEIENIKAVSKMQIFDVNQNQIKPISENYISIKKLPSYTKNAFICAEDKRFFNHKGLDYIRICGAFLSNLKTKSFSEGASTISQQLIKNTHLSSEKTIKRKLKEIKLTKELEKKYNKSEILEMYLNNIYFGNGCYGIENAAKHYFDKSASSLTLAESAMLAGTINAPSFYDIQNKTETAESRRNLILGLMEKYGKISKEEKEEAIKEKTKLKLTKLSNNNFIYDEIIKEACKLLSKTETQLKNSNLQIFTNYNLNLQNEINSKIKNQFSSIENNPEIATIIIENKNNKIISMTGSKSTLTAKKQPGSTIKPILVYAPAIENNNISPATKILDEPINISGYSPENADKKHHGYVSVRECLKHSYNIPAVKILNENGIKNSQNFANKLGIEFSKNDDNLSIALGGFTNGITLKTLCDAYSSFANNGYFSPSNFITKITKNGNTIYSSQNSKTKVMNDSTAFLITDMLIDTAKEGTAKRLNILPFEVASKTGTVGVSGSRKNTDAFNVCYTTSHTIVSYIGGTSLSENINGSTYPTMISKIILENLYSNSSPKNFSKPTSIESKKLNKSKYDQNILSPALNNEDFIEELFSKSNLKKIETVIPNLELKVSNFKNKKPILTFQTIPNFSIEIIRKNKNKEEIISSLNDIKNAKVINFEDKNASSNTIYEYFVHFFNNSKNQSLKTNSVKLKTF